MYRSPGKSETQEVVCLSQYRLKFYTDTLAYGYLNACVLFLKDWMHRDGMAALMLARGKKGSDVAVIKDMQGSAGRRKDR